MTVRDMRRFYKTASVAEEPTGWAVALDGRPLITPAKARLLVPTEALASAIAVEWDRQGQTISPQRMPLTQLAATAIDRTRADRDRVIREIAGYGASDLVCYRAGAPADLVALQSATWDPLLAWLRERYDVHLNVTTGIVATAQPERAAETFLRVVRSLDEFALTAAANITQAVGSLVIALALVEGRLAPADAFRAGFLDELYQARKWGDDSETKTRQDRILLDIESSARFLELLRPGDSASRA